MTAVGEFIEHLSTTPWSNYTAADYSIQQWHNACLIHMHDGPPTSKNECKLPVKTPDGAVNQNGVLAAAAALAGARGGVHASSEQKASAAKTLVRYYKDMGKEPPPSLLKHSVVEEFIQHHGVKGMHWGVRNKRTRKETRIRNKRQQIANRRRQISDSDLEKFIKRLDNEKKLKTLTEQDLKPGRSVAKKIAGDTGKKVISTVAAGTAMLAVKYAVERKLTPKFDAEGKKIKIKLDPKSTADLLIRGGKPKKG